MSQDPGPTLEAPKVAFKKKKLNRNYVPPPDTNNLNNTNSSPSNLNENSNTSGQQAQVNQAEQTPPPQVITDISTLGPLKKKRLIPKFKSSESTSEASEATENTPQSAVQRNDNTNNSSLSTQQTNQQEQASLTQAPQVITDISSLGPLKKKKKKIIETLPDNSQNTADSSAPSSTTPIETNEIPNIDLTNDSSNDISSISSSSTRLGLDIEQDNTLSGRYMNPNFDLSRIGKNESRQLLNKSISKEYAERFTKDMTAREEQFRKEYIKPKEKVDEQLVNADFLQTELNSMIEAISKNVQSNTENFDLNKCNFDDITITSGTSFKPNLNGLAKSYTMNSQEAIDTLSGKHELLSVDELKTELGAEFLKTSKNANIDKEDIIKQVKTLYNQSNKQISPTEFVIDLSLPESVNLICNIGLFFAAGLKCHPTVLFTRLYGQMNEDSRGRANIVSLQAALLQAKSSVTDITGNYRYTVFYVLHLIRLAQCSALLRYMSGLLTFKKKNYYADALILDSDLCNSLADEIEKIECVQIQGGLVHINITDLTPAVPGDRFALRVSGIVDSYLRKTRNWLLQGVEINSEHILPLTDVLKIFVKSFLMQKNGNCISLDALYEIFEGIANLSAQNNTNQNNSNGQDNLQQNTIDPCCNHPAYKKFVEIFKSKDVTKYWETRTKVWVTIVTALNEKILPYIILFGVNIPQTKATMNPAYFRDPVSCLKIANALLPMKFPVFNIRYESIKSNVSTLD